VTIEGLVDKRKPSILAGNAGTGKTTCLKKIGELLINKNSERKGSLPIFVTVEELFSSNYDIESIIKDKIQNVFLGSTIDDIFTSYKCYILIDSIDELEDTNQKNVLLQLEKLFKVNNIIYIIGSRNHEKLLSVLTSLQAETYMLEKFNFEQIRRFVGKFFPNQSTQGELLLEALKENRIIEHLPITPLTLSLISILYEEKNFEIPATITDIYDNFSSLLLGRPVVSSRIEFIDISFKERILSLYGLELLKRPEHTPMTHDEFISFFEEYYLNKTLPFERGHLKSILDYLIDHTGLLQLKHNRFVQFSHDSFMEYFAATEVFKHQRTLEHEYVSNFFEGNWQNSSIFYAGKSKDMPDFLDQINKRLLQASKFKDLLSGVMGAGYLLQALYQTDNLKRKETVIAALNLNLQILELFLKLANDDVVLYKNYKLPVMWAINIFYFHENFNSITLREPLKLTFEEYYDKYIIDNDTTTGYLALNLALTLTSKRINEKDQLQKLIFDSKLTDDAVLCLLTDYSLGIFSGQQIREAKKDLHKEVNKLNKPFVHLSKLNASQARYSNYDIIHISKKYRIITEGITDAEIIEHAYMTLTNGELPYWSIRPSGKLGGGGASEVSKCLMNCMPTLFDDDYVIGIFDHDAKGLQEFNGGLKVNTFELKKNNTLKKHKDSNIYAICLPVPGDKEVYLQEKQEFNFFSIEHYFDHKELEQFELLKKTSIPEIFEIKDSKKKAFSKYARSKKSPEFFRDFLELFKLIDEITEVKIEYIID
jgi:hypothetical protein